MTAARGNKLSLPGNVVSSEILVRIFLLGLFVCFDQIEPFQRKIQPEEAWLYKNPRTTSYVSPTLLIALALLVPSSVFILWNQQRPLKCRSDLSAAHLGFTLAILITGILTNIIKVIVGRPRPDFFFRCFPSGDGDFSSTCTGDSRVIAEGRKSFPSGHASIIFSSYTFLSLYLMSKFEISSSPFGRQQTFKIIVATSPLFVALIVALSRTCDYHHHWQDVTVGSLLGSLIGYLCYRQQYPSVFDQDSGTPLLEYPVYDETYGDEELGSGAAKQNVKWI